jgi:hypothetical protein
LEKIYFYNFIVYKTDLNNHLVKVKKNTISLKDDEHERYETRRQCSKGENWRTPFDAPFVKRVRGVESVDTHYYCIDRNAIGYYKDF